VSGCREEALERAEHAEIAVLDLTGRHLAALADRSYEAGEHVLNREGRDTRGRALSSGIYLMGTQSESGVQVLGNAVLIR